MKTASFFESVQFNSNKPALTLMLDTDFSKEIRIVFKKGQVMESHSAPFAIIIQVLKGIIDFGVNNKINQLKEGSIVALKPHEIHDLTALEDSIVRLSLSKTDSVKRVKNVVK